MKYTLACLLFSICFTALCQDTYNTTWKTDNEVTSGNNALNTPRPFITTWQTDSLNQVRYPIDASESDTSFIIDWGDGSVDTVTRGTYIHTYDVSDIYTVSVWGNLDNPSFEGEQNILSVEQWGDSKWKSMNRAFMSCDNLRVPATDAPDLSNVTSLTGIFAGATSFDDPLGHWDVSNVEHFHGVFLGASSFNQPLNDWDLCNAISLDQMFEGAISFNQPLDLWDVSNVRQISWIFENAISFDQNIGSWNIKNVNNTVNFLENSGLSMKIMIQP